ncbi:MAG: hypothetical protein CSYNP_04011 [Syntrophus sp. SKADARSKE-3]|nr:hypothetical protein [Syntrophus sp. SKADARSKE-3]
MAVNLGHLGSSFRGVHDVQRACRRVCFNSHTRYTETRIDNRTHPEELWPTSLWSMLDNVKSWTAKPIRVIFEGELNVEILCFGSRTLQTPQISGVDCQQVTMAGHGVQAYLLEQSETGSQMKPLHVSMSLAERFTFTHGDVHLKITAAGGV